MGNVVGSAIIEVSADATGVAVGIGKAKRSLADLANSATTAGKQASTGIEKLGLGGTIAAASVDRSTQRMIDAIQRTQVALESGGRSSAKYFETIASQKGLNAEALKPYIESLSLAEAKQKSAQSLLEGFGATAKKVAGLLGVGLSFAFFKSIIDDTIAARSELLKMSYTVGDSVENLGALSRIGKASGTSLSEISQATIKLNKNLVSNEEGSKGAQQAIEALGLSYAKLKSATPVEQLQQVAKALAGYEDGAGKATAVTLLFGKEAASLLPFLKDLAEQTKLTSRTTTEAAREADQYRRNLIALNTASDEWKRNLAEAVIPTLTRFTSELLEGKKAMGDFFGGLQIGALTSPFQTAGENLNDVRVTIDKLTKSIADMQAEKAKGGLSAFFSAGPGDVALNKAIRDLETYTRLKNYLVTQQTREALAGTSGEVLDRFDRKPRLTLTAPKGGGGGAVRQEADDYARLIKQVTELSATSQAALEGEERLNEAQRLGAKIAADYAAGLLKVTPAQLGILDATLKNANAALKEGEARERAKRWMDEATNSNAAFVEAQMRLRDSDLAAAKAAEDALAAYGLTEQELRALTVARQRDAAAALLQKANQADAAYLEDIAGLYREQAAAILRAADAKERLDLIMGRTKEAQHYNDILKDSFTDSFSSFISGTKSAKDAFRSFTDSVVQQINRITAQQIAEAALGKGGGNFGGAGSSGGWLGSLISLAAGYFSGGNVNTSYNYQNGSDLGFVVGKRAAGGPVSRGRMYEINERGGGEILNAGGRQYLMPAVDGSVKPAAAAPGRTLNQTIVFNSSQPTSKATQTQLAAAAFQGAQQAYARNG